MKKSIAPKKESQEVPDDSGLSQELIKELAHYGLDAQGLRDAINNPANRLWLEQLHPSFTMKWKLTFSRLVTSYKTLYPKSRPEDFRVAVINAVAAKDLSLDDPLSIPYQAASVQDKEKGRDWVLANTPHAIILISCAYLLHAAQSWTDVDQEWKWAHLVDANYWCGIAMMQLQSDNGSPDYERLVRKEIAAKGAQARDKKYAPLRELALKLAKEKRPKVHGWPSRRQAVIAVKNEVLDEARKRNMPLSEDNAFVTIDGWLAKMPEAEELFPKRTPKSAG